MRDEADLDQRRGHPGPGEHREGCLPHTPARDAGVAHHPPLDDLRQTGAVVSRLAEREVREDAADRVAALRRRGVGSAVLDLGEQLGVGVGRVRGKEVRLDAAGEQAILQLRHRVAVDGEEQVRAGLVRDLRAPGEGKIGVGFARQHYRDARLLHRLLGPDRDRERHVLLDQSASAMRAIVRIGAPVARVEHDHQGAPRWLGRGSAGEAKEQRGEPSHARHDSRRAFPP